MSQFTEDDGTVVDLISAESVPGSKIRPLREPPSSNDAAGLPRRALRRSAPDTVRYVRPAFQRYVRGDRAKNFEEYLKTMPASVPADPRQAPPGIPTAGSQRLYASTYVNWDNLGATSAVNAGFSDADIPATGEFYIAQTNVMTWDPTGAGADEWVGLVIGRFPDLYDTEMRVMSEFYTAGAAVKGDYAGGWSAPLGVAGFIPRSGASNALGDTAIGLSWVGGTQSDHQVAIVWDAMCDAPGCTGAWWLGYDHEWIGHYPIGARTDTATQTIPFDLINVSAAQIQFYGEIYDATETNWTFTDMGSPLPPTPGAAHSFGQSAYFRNLQGLDRPSGQWQTVNISNVIDPGGNDPNCYAVNVVDHGDDPNFHVTAYFGGPGAADPAVDPSNTCRPY